MASGAEARATRAKRREEVEARLSAALIEIAADRPYGEITIEQIAKGAGLSRSAFYFYFRDKADLLVAAARDVVAVLFSQSGEYWDGSGDPHARVRNALARNVETFFEHESLLRMTMEVSTHDEVVGEFWRGSLEDFIAAVSARIRADQQAGLVPAEIDPDRFGAALVLTAQGYLWRTVSRNGDSPAETTAVLSEIWNRVLYPAPAPAN